MEPHQKINFYEKRDLGDKINVTFQFLRQNFVPLFKSLLYIAGPVILVAGVVGGLYQMTLLSTGGIYEPTEPSFDTFGALFAQGSVNILVSILMTAVVITVVYEYFVLYMQADTLTFPTVSAVWEGTKRDFLKVLLSSVVTSILVGIGIIFLIIPGLILLAALSLIFIIQIKERLSFGDAFSRCFSLTSGNYLSTLGLLLVVAILQTIIVLVLLTPIGLITGLGLFFSDSAEDIITRQSSTFYQILAIVGQVFSNLVTQLLSAISTVAIAFQYSNLVEKKESTGLMENVNTIGERSVTDEDDERY